MQQALKRTLKHAGIKFVRVLWCDNANVIRAKAAHVDYLEDVIDNGVGITMAQMALPVMYDSVVAETGLGPVGDGAHAVHEHLVVDAWVDRCALLALLLMAPVER